MTQKGLLEYGEPIKDGTRKQTRYIISYRTSHMGSLPVRSSVVTSEAISMSGAFVGVGAAIVTARGPLLMSFTCTDVDGMAWCGTKAEDKLN